MRARTGRLRRLISSKLAPRRRGIEIEQRALRDREPDRALDVAGGQIVAALSAARKAPSSTRRACSQASREPPRVT